MTTTNYKGYKLRVQKIPRMPLRDFERWMVAVGDKIFSGNTQTEAVTNAKAWIDAQEDLEPPDIDDEPHVYCHVCGDEIPADYSECGCDAQEGTE